MAATVVRPPDRPPAGTPAAAPPACASRRVLAGVLAAAVLTLAVGSAPVPLWDEDEPRFAAIARTMVETGDWVVPMYNGTLAVDKPVLMHWCMAAAMTLCGPTEFAARLPSVLATLATVLALFRAGVRWFDPATGGIAALAFVGCLLVGIEAHAATPDAILVALTAWATLLAAEPLVAARARCRPCGDGSRADREWGDGDGGPPPRMSLLRACGVGLLLGLAVVCKGPIGLVGPLAVLAPWAWWLALERRLAGRAAAGGMVRQAVPALGEVFTSLRPLVVIAVAVATAAPWYVAVSLRTDGEWVRGFLLVHNVGRFLTPMERHGGSGLFHPLALLVGFYPWSCFLPLAVAVAAWRVWRRRGPPQQLPVLGLLLVWLVVWVGGFSAAATKLPNYVLPAYPAAALLVAAAAVAAARQPRWPHPRWLGAGLVSLALGGLATSVTVVVAARYGLDGGEPAAILGIVPVVGALACGWCGRVRPRLAVAAFTITALAYTALACGPAATWLARANRLPGLVATLAADAPPGGIGTYGIGSPNVVYYAGGRTRVVTAAGSGTAAGGQARDPDQPAGTGSGGLEGIFGPDLGGVLLVPEDRLDELRGRLPADAGEIARARPLFRRHEVVAIRIPPSRPRAAALPGATR